MGATFVGVRLRGKMGCSMSTATLHRPNSIKVIFTATACSTTYKKLMQQEKEGTIVSTNFLLAHIHDTD